MEKIIATAKKIITEKAAKKNNLATTTRWSDTKLFIPSDSLPKPFFTFSI
jgi:hypothetical protein